MHSSNAVVVPFISKTRIGLKFNPLNAELNPICHLLALLAHHIFHVNGLRAKDLCLM